MLQYLNSMQCIINHGVSHGDRTGVGRRSIFGVQQRYNLADGFPLLTTKKVFHRGVFEEMLFFIRGDHNADHLSDIGVNIWNEWKVSELSVDEFILKYMPEVPDMVKGHIKEQLMARKGSIGPMYGVMWRNAPRSCECGIEPNTPIDEMPSDKLAMYQAEYDDPEYLKEALKHSGLPDDGEIPPFSEYAQARYRATVDQLQQTIVNLKKNPHSSRHVISAWIPEFIPFENIDPCENVLLGRGALAPCHALFQFNVVDPDEVNGKFKLSLQMYQRSSDYFLGVPFNIAQYALLLSMVAHVCNMEAGEFIWVSGDTHLYFNQFEAANEQLARVPGTLPKLWLNPEVTDIYKFTIDDIKVLDYHPQEAIKVEVAR